MDNVKKIYGRVEALVTDEVLGMSDAEIDEAVYEPQPGTLIYNADLSIFKQRDLDGKWVRISTGGNDGADGKSAYELAKEEDPEIGDEKAWIASLKGDTGEKGKDGTNGKDGKSVATLALKTDEDGKLVGGIVTFDDDTTAAISIQPE